MRIIGIGNDIVSVDRIDRAAKDAFMRYCFTDAERLLFGSPLRVQSVAGNFAGKEAVVKAFGTGFRNCGPRDIEILRDDGGRPVVKLYNGAKRIADGQGIRQIWVSISHSREYATAFAVAEG